MHELNPNERGKTSYDWALTKTTPTLGVELEKEGGQLLKVLF